MSGPVAIGLDLGTSALKGVAVALDGRVLERVAVAYPTARPEPGAAEQDPADWLAAFRVAIAGLAVAVPRERWVAVGLSAMLPTLVLADADLRPLGPALTWEDGRAEGAGLRLRAAVGAEALYARTGQWVDGRYLLPAALRLLELDGERGATARRASWVLGAKDWLFARLTGVPATDPSTAAGFGAFDLTDERWNEEILARLRTLGPAAAPLGDAIALPPVRPAGHAARVSAAAAAELGLLEGLPVILGAADSVLAARGLGVDAPGRAAYVAGTSTVILGIAPRLVVDAAHRFLVTPLERPGPVGLEMDLVATGSAVAWLARLIGLADGDEAGVWRLAGELEPGAGGLTGLPYLGHGEQGALWDPDLRGGFLGLTLAHDRRHLARALLDGIVLESRRCLAVLAETAGAAGEVVVSGSSLRSAAFVRALADASGRRVRWPEEPDHPASAWGTAALAFEATGFTPPSGPALAPGIEPDPGAAAGWAERFARLEAARLAAGTVTSTPTAAQRRSPR